MRLDHPTLVLPSASAFANWWTWKEMSSVKIVSHGKASPFRAALSQLAPAVIEADVRAAALAEATFGAGKPFKEFLYVTVGTGICCCLVLDGKLFTGSHGASGTMASSPLSVLCEQCGATGLDAGLIGAAATAWRTRS